MRDHFADRYFHTEHTIVGGTVTDDPRNVVSPERRRTERSSPPGEPPLDHSLASVPSP
jgi:hypothetical protein